MKQTNTRVVSRRTIEAKIISKKGSLEMGASDHTRRIATTLRKLAKRMRKIRALLRKVMTSQRLIGKNESMESKNTVVIRDYPLDSSMDSKRNTIVTWNALCKTSTLSSQ